MAATTVRGSVDRAIDRDDPTTYVSICTFSLNGWDIEVVKPPTRVVSTTIAAFMDTKEFGSNIFLLPLVPGQTEQIAISILKANIERFQMTAAQEQYDYHRYNGGFLI